ncbi:MAG: FMN-binding negative transcriptional regulator [Gammaproteobacteria bacterium]|nr:FMN-binding negative transcriptional regulator [Gammaproteobacteria bacterium]
MYTPESFKVDEPARLQQMMRRHPFALLLTKHDHDFEATHLPFMLEPELGPHGTLLAHMARANPHWRLFDGRRESLVVFTGPHAYISPSWYESPVTVPTWNYAVIHAHGRPVVIQDKTRVRALLEQLVSEHEAYVQPPWSTAQADAYIQKQLDHIVAFEIQVTRLEGKFKLSQNRSRADQQGVVRGLSGSDDPSKRDIAELMRQQLEPISKFRSP